MVVGVGGGAITFNLFWVLNEGGQGKKYTKHWGEGGGASKNLKGKIPKSS